MDPNSVDYRRMILNCLREDVTNHRIAQENIHDRIRQALARARENLERIRQLNVEIQEMKVTVENALAEITEQENVELVDPLQTQCELQDVSYEDIIGNESNDEISQQ
ncbi:GH16797 [Drosophila grimshawi]|uniref:GH16797 n=1 Tax=Drosophila grimshawi TaxID=7222 RepID=B4IWS4_DROGR|nr:GH16797 [Drosophila grimshawi]